MNAQISNPATLLERRLSINAMKPVVQPDGRTFIFSNSGKQFVTNDGLLMYDEWKDLDRAVFEVQRDRLVGIADLRAAGLTHNLGGLGVTIAQWEMSSDMTKANVSMSGASRGEEDTSAFKQATVPVPILHKDFRLNIRRLEASRRFGSSIDVLDADSAARKVAEASEEMLFAGKPIVVDGSEIYGYTTHPARSTVDLGTAWDDNAVDGGDILEDVQEMLAEARDNNYHGPFTLYIPSEYEGKLDNDFEQGTGDIRTIRERLLQLSGLSRIVVADRLPADNVILVQLTRNVVDLAVGQEMTTVQWQSQGGMVEHFKVMAAWAPRIKNDYDGRSGIVHLRPA